MGRGLQSWSNDSSSAFVSLGKETGRNRQMEEGRGGGRDLSHQERLMDKQRSLSRIKDAVERIRGRHNAASNDLSRGDTEKDYHRHKFQDEYNDEEEEVYIVRQEWAYLSILFSFAQTVIMGLMMWQCGVAPLNINPMVGPYPDALSEWGGKNATLILEDNQWWRLFTPIMLHAGLLHLLGNVAVQLEAGAFFEKEWGSVRWLIIYLGSAVASSSFSVITMPEAISVGSSGAVMGIFGAKLAEVLLRCCESTETKEKRVSSKVRQEQCASVTCSVIVVMLFSFIPYVDWAAHLGGLIGGIVIGTFIFACELEHICCQSLWFLVGLALTLGTYVGLIWYMYNIELDGLSDALRDVCGYYQEQFDDYECHCMKEEYLKNLNYGGNTNL